MSVMNNMPDFVRSREKVGYVIFAIIVTALLVSGLYAILPAAITFFALLQTMAMKVLVLAGTVTVGSFILLNMKTLWLVMKAVSRWLTNEVVAIFPVEVLEECIAEAEEKRKELSDHLASLNGVRESTQTQVENLQNQESVLLERIRAINSEDDPDFHRNALELGNQHGIVEASLKRRRRQLENLNQLCKGLDDSAEICDRYINTRRKQLELLKADLEAAKAEEKAIKSARSVLGAFSGNRDQWNIAVDLINDKSARSFADVKVFLQEIKGDIVERDIDNLVALKRVQEIRRDLTGVRVDPLATKASGTAESALDRELRAVEARRAGGSR